MNSRVTTAIHIEDDYAPRISFHLLTSGPAFLVQGIEGGSIWLTLKGTQALVDALMEAIAKVAAEV